MSMGFSNPQIVLDESQHLAVTEFYPVIRKYLKSNHTYLLEKLILSDFGLRVTANCLAVVHAY